jgi:hypothetical protein
LFVHEDVRERQRQRDTMAKKTYRSFVKAYLSWASHGESVFDITTRSLRIRVTFSYKQKINKQLQSLCNSHNNQIR